MSQEKYDYVVLSKQDFMLPKCEEESKTKAKVEPPVFSVDSFNTQLGKYGDDGFRVITKLYSGDGEWLLILSKPIYVPRSPSEMDNRGNRIRE